MVSSPLLLPFRCVFHGFARGLSFFSRVISMPHGLFVRALPSGILPILSILPIHVNSVLLNGEFGKRARKGSQEKYEKSQLLI